MFITDVAVVVVGAAVVVVAVVVVSNCPEPSSVIARESRFSDSLPEESVFFPDTLFEVEAGVWDPLLWPFEVTNMSSGSSANMPFSSLELALEPKLGLESV